MKQYSLNELFSQLKNGKIKQVELEGQLYYYFFNNQEKTCLCHWKRDEYEDYISWFYPYIKKAINTYSEKGSSFEAYINKFMKNSSREYRVRVTTQSVTEYSAWYARIPELYTREEAPEYWHDKEENPLTAILTEQNGRTEKRRILALILKCYYYVSDDFIDRIANKIEMDIGELREMINKIREIRQKKDDALYFMKERIYCQYYRCIVFEKRLLFIQENTAAYEKLKLRLEKAKLRLERMRKRITLIRTEATNEQVAQVIGVKKGTIDSSLHKLRIKLKELSDKSQLN
jgi:DNA-directed RNA polymerase specialized sigma24 family protein